MKCASIFKFTLLLPCALSLMNTDNEIYTGCGFDAVPGQPRVLQFCTVYGYCIKVYCGHDSVFSKENCGCIKALRLPPNVPSRPPDPPSTRPPQPLKSAPSHTHTTAPKTRSNTQDAHLTPPMQALNNPKDLGQMKPADTVPKTADAIVKLKELLRQSGPFHRNGTTVAPKVSGADTFTNNPPSMEHSTVMSSLALLPDGQTTRYVGGLPRPELDGRDLSFVPSTTSTSSLSSGVSSTMSTSSLSSSTSESSPVYSSTSSTYSSSSSSLPLSSTNIRPVATTTRPSKMLTSLSTIPSFAATSSSSSGSLSTLIISTLSPSLSTSPLTSFSSSSLSTLSSSSITSTSLPTSASESTLSSSYSITSSSPSSTQITTTTTARAATSKTTAATTTITRISPTSTLPLSTTTTPKRTVAAKPRLRTTTIRPVRTRQKLSCGAELNITGIDSNKVLTGTGAFGMVYIGNRGVTSKEGRAYFNGRSFLWIPLYESNRFTSGITISLEVQENEVLQTQQALINNCGSDTSPSVSIVLDPKVGRVIFKAEATNRNTPYPMTENLKVSVPYTPGVSKIIEMQCDGRKLIGRVDDDVVEAKLGGTESYELSSRDKPLYIGKRCRPDGTNNFNGEISNIAVFRCVH